MDQLFDLLKASGNNSIEKIIDLFKEAKLLDPVKADMEGKVRELFKDAPNPEDITVEKFTEVLTKFADDQQKTVEEFSDMLIAAGTELLQLTEDAEGTLAQLADIAGVKSDPKA